MQLLKTTNQSKNLTAASLNEIRTIRLPHTQRKIALPTLEGIHFERVQDIVCIEADGNYANLKFIDGHQILVCKTLRELEEMLQFQAQFIRIHRSNLINLNWLKQYIRGKGGQVKMEDNSLITVSAGRKSAFLLACERYFG